ncbi:hypothetical protein T06_13859 [Trichinella sp. T6]|nr:hypothetical protein T06_13859 [Trichinella sp. T6]
MKSAVPPLLQPDLEQNERHRLIQMRQTLNRGNKSFPLAQFKDAAGENRGWLLATDPRDPTSRVSFGHRQSLMVRWGSGSKPLRNKPLIYKRAASRGILSSGRVWSATAVTARTWMMATRRRDRGSEDEPAKSDSGRTGADPEEANKTTPPRGSLHMANKLADVKLIFRLEQQMMAKANKRPKIMA